MTADDGSRLYPLVTAVSRFPRPALEYGRDDSCQNRSVRRFILLLLETADGMTILADPNHEVSTSLPRGSKSQRASRGARQEEGMYDGSDCAGLVDGE